MWAKWLAGAGLLLGCGEIREVPVPLGMETGSDATPGSGSTSSTGDGSTTMAACGVDCDTDPASPLDVASTTEPPDDRRLVCNHELTLVAAGDAGGGSATVEVEPGLAVVDVDVLVRMFHERPRSVHLVLKRDGSPPIDLIHNLEGDAPCRVDLSVRFDDDASARAADYCEQETELALVAPVTPIAELVGDDVAGAWTLDAIIPSSAALDGTLETFCLALALAE